VRRVDVQKPARADPSRRATGGAELEPLARALAITGLVLLGLALWLHMGPSVPWLGRLPGDLRIERPGFQLYLPLTSCLVVSAVLSAILWIAGRLR
jgi:hypothetical protein